MALILARKIRQYRSIVSILQQSSKEIPLGFAPAIEALLSKKSHQGRGSATHFPTGPALLVSFIRHHKATKEDSPPPVCCSWWAPSAGNIDIVKKSQFLFTPVCFALIAS